MSAELGLGKGELLGGEDGASVGVRLALGETHLVRQTKAFLESHGVALDEFGLALAPSSFPCLESWEANRDGN